MPFAHDFITVSRWRRVKGRDTQILLWNREFHFTKESVSVGQFAFDKKISKNH